MHNWFPKLLAENQNKYKSTYQHTEQIERFTNPSTPADNTNFITQMLKAWAYWINAFTRNYSFLILTNFKPFSVVFKSPCTQNVSSNHVWSNFFPNPKMAIYTQSSGIPGSITFAKYDPFTPICQFVHDRVKTETNNTRAFSTKCLKKKCKIKPKQLLSEKSIYINV